MLTAEVSLLELATGCASLQVITAQVLHQLWSLRQLSQAALLFLTLILSVYQQLIPTKYTLCCSLQRKDLSCYACPDPVISVPDNSWSCFVTIWLTRMARQLLNCWQASLAEPGLCGQHSCYCRLSSKLFVMHSSATYRSLEQDIHLSA